MYGTYKGKPVLYMAVTADKWEFPVAVAANPSELDRMLGRRNGWTLQTIAHNTKHPTNGRGGKGFYHVYRVFMQGGE